MRYLQEVTGIKSNKLAIKKKETSIGNKTSHLQNLMIGFCVPNQNLGNHS